MLCLNHKSWSSSCHWKNTVFRRLFYKDQCICSKSTASPKFVSVSKRLMITAMAASSLLRLLRPGPTTLSKSSWEFSPEDIWAAREKTDKLASYMETIKEVRLKYPLVFPLLRTRLPVAHSLSWIFLASPLGPLHLAPTDQEKHITCHLQQHGSSLLMSIKNTNCNCKPSEAVRYLKTLLCLHHKPKIYACNSPFADWQWAFVFTLLLAWLWLCWHLSCGRLKGLTLPLDGEEFSLNKKYKRAKPENDKSR